ncbi:MAG TPA: hypothetical protein VFJ71_02515 [Candidatus Limnocylindrales bacterium]|nr:hypothetical protein [Candidatus Limnocylindrales bacterium]
MATTHLLLASLVAILAIIGLFAHPLEDGDRGISLVGGFPVSFFIVLPMSGIVAFGLLDWQMGRGASFLRAADGVAFLLALVELSLGVAGLARWMIGTMAILAAAGLAASLLVPAPRRPGFRR